MFSNFFWLYFFWHWKIILFNCLFWGVVPLSIEPIKYIFENFTLKCILKNLLTRLRCFKWLNCLLLNFKLFLLEFLITFLKIFKPFRYKNVMWSLFFYLARVKCAFWIEFLFALTFKLLAKLIYPSQVFIMTVPKSLCNFFKGWRLHSFFSFQSISFRNHCALMCIKVWCDQIIKCFLEILWLNLVAQ